MVDRPPCREWGYTGFSTSSLDTLSCGCKWKTDHSFHLSFPSSTRCSKFVRMYMYPKSNKKAHIVVQTSGLFLYLQRFFFCQKQDTSLSLVFIHTLAARSPVSLAGNVRTASSGDRLKQLFVSLTRRTTFKFMLPTLALTCYLRGWICVSPLRCSHLRRQRRLSCAAGVVARKRD